ncbi:hypothetical protein SEA_GODONK_63 [Gordonia phage GodonK]|uniref:Uncharacterized protein n=1 Tax=Gordonia phage GodonK TaxID=2562192 RepID=A0A4D6E3R2_9CAUD|nr:hypothetical protein HOV33_gp063 [Gordonia phage GodonK]QBZ72682.1 hypothetical protein SEA_GODONK_63 [Gordonia phage GodonK]
MELMDLVEDGVVRAAASMFPVEVTVDSAGFATARFILAKSPDDDWYALGWRLDNMGKPSMFVYTKVIDIVSFRTSLIDVNTEAGRILVRPSSGGCCGNRLKTYNPFGPSVSLARVPVSKEG